MNEGEPGGEWEGGKGSGVQSFTFARCTSCCCCSTWRLPMQQQGEHLLAFLLNALPSILRLLPHICCLAATRHGHCLKEAAVGRFHDRGLRGPRGGGVAGLCGERDQQSRALYAFIMCNCFQYWPEDAASPEGCSSSQTQHYTRITRYDKPIGTEWSVWYASSYADNNRSMYTDGRWHNIRACCAVQGSRRRR